MKAAFFLKMFSLVSPVISYGQLLEAPKQVISQKIYVEPSQLIFDHGKIFAYIEGQWRSVISIHCDSHGYVAMIPTRWVCRLCSYNNHELATTCERWYPDRQVFCRNPRHTK